MSEKYRYSLFEDSFAIDFRKKSDTDKMVKKMKIMAGPQCSECGYYVDKTLEKYTRFHGKIFGPKQICQKCIGLPDESFYKLEKIYIDLDRFERNEKKKEMDAKMDIYRRK